MFEPIIVDTKHIGTGVDLVSQYVRSGGFKFKDIVKDFYATEGEDLKYYFDILKTAYGAYYQIASDIEAESMYPVVRHYKYEEMVVGLKKIED